MAKGKKTGGRDFKPGVSGNPLGKPRLPEDLKSARRLTSIYFTALANKYLSMTKDQIREAASNPQTPALELLVASIISKAVNEGDETRLEFLLNRLIGKVADKYQIDPIILETFEVLKNKSNAELIEIVESQKPALITFDKDKESFD